MCCHEIVTRKCFLPPEPLRVHLDVTHAADANFMRNLPPLLESAGCRVSLSCLRRGRLPEIVKTLYPGLPVAEIGRYARPLAGKVFLAGLLRLIGLANYFRRHPVNVLAGVVCFLPAALRGIFGFRTVGVYDDLENRPQYELTRRLSDRFLVPACLGDRREGVLTFRGLKEWAHLSPRYFRPDPDVPRHLGMEPGTYLFVRSVDPSSMNYRRQSGDVVERLYREGLAREPAVLSLERREHAARFPAWHVLKEPLQDVHSLLYHAKMVVSSGDSVAREGAQLGVPTLYCGIRDMRANQGLIDRGLLIREAETAKAVDLVRTAPPGFSSARRERIRAELLDAWDDPNLILRDLILEAGGRGGHSGSFHTSRTVRGEAPS